jgi:hypothetical protein
VGSLGEHDSGRHDAHDFQLLELSPFPWTETLTPARRRRTA